MSTIFTQIINREIPADIVYEDDVCLAFRDINPQAPVHVLLIPKKEIVSMATVETGDQTVLGHLMVKASEIASMLGAQRGRIQACRKHERGRGTKRFSPAHTYSRRKETHLASRIISTAEAVTDLLPRKNGLKPER